MGDDEGRGVQIALRILRIPAAEGQPDLGAQLEVKVSEVGAVRVADGAQRLTSADDLAWFDQHLIEVRIERLDPVGWVDRTDAVDDADHSAPTSAVIERGHHHSVGYGPDRVAEVGIAPAETIPVGAEMIVVAEGLRVIVAAGPSSRAHRKTKPVGAGGSAGELLVQRAPAVDCASRGPDWRQQQERRDDRKARRFHQR